MTVRIVEVDGRQVSWKGTLHGLEEVSTMGIGSAIAEKDLGDRKTTMEEFTKGLKDTRHGDNGTYITPDGRQHHGQWSEWAP
mmetsp:Transcript_25277/g.34762  ORF Transcript_25277/g.34762 Transcript_25277/m.34762 type:complete len:82 (+) Transcript_25277:338-583(+)